MTTLNQKQRLFVDWYIKLANGTQAAKKAGYSGSDETLAVTATRLLKNNKVQAFYKERMLHLEEILGFNKATVIQDLHAIKERSMQAVPVMIYDPKEKAMVQKTELTEDGAVGVYQFDSNGANRAIENINKMMGYNEPEKTEDVTPLDNKPAAIVINKQYVNNETNKPTT